MNFSAVLFTAALTVACAWIPVFLRFLRSWRTRGNPISLAICALVMLALYVPVFAVLEISASWPLATVIAIDGITCATFYVTVHVASRKFPDVRGTRSDTPKDTTEKS